MKTTLYRAVHRSGAADLPREFKTIALAECLLKSNPDDWRVEPFEIEAQPEADAKFLTDIMRRAQNEANCLGVEIAVIRDEIGNAEEIENGHGPYGYCLPRIWRTIFPCGQLVCTVKPEA